MKSPQGSEMIERVARAIYSKRNGVGAKPWSLLPMRHKEPYMDDARAAIEAMREPTKAMLDDVVGPNAKEFEVAPVEAEWRDMISAALRDTG